MYQIRKPFNRPREVKSTGINKTERMITKHKIFFKMWLVWMYLQGIKTGLIVYKYSPDKNKFIKGRVMCLNGNSITTDIFAFTISIDWIEPLVGYDYNCFSKGTYNYAAFKKEIEKHPSCL